MIKGRKIILRPFCLNDSKYILEIKSDSKGVKAFAGSPFPSNKESEEEWIKNMYPKGLPDSIYYVIEEAGSNKFIGYVVAKKIDYINLNAEVGIIFHENARGKGYFKTVSVLFYNYLFDTINLHKIYSTVLVYNEIAIENDKKIGFTVDGTIKEHVFQSGKYHDVYFVSLLKKNFIKNSLNKEILKENNYE